MFRKQFLSAVPLFAFVLAMFFTSCRSVQKYVESGDYDAAIDYCVNRLSGKKKKKDEYVRGLEVAFRRAQARDLAEVDRLAGETHPENWDEIRDIYRDISRRQEKIEPLLPLRSTDGYQAKFTFINASKLENESREKAADHLYAKAAEHLERAENGSRWSAREAYKTLEELERRFFKNYKNTREMKGRARQLGTSHVVFEVKNASDKLLPRHFNEQILAIGKKDLDSEWKAFHFGPEAGVEMDYRVVFKIRRIEMSPERIHERAYTDEKDIQDGWNYVLDRRGNVRKDTLGNDIKTPRMVRIRADVLEILQTKSARLTGFVEIFDAKTDALLSSENLGTEVVFEHYASTFRGDERALTDDSRCRIGSRPAAFPSDEDLLIQAADLLKPKLREALRSSKAIL